MPSTIPELVDLFAYGDTALIKQATMSEGTCYCPVHEPGGKNAGHKSASLGLWRGDKIPVIFKCRSRDCDPKLIRQAFLEAGADLGAKSRPKMLRKNDCGTWIRPITADMMNTRPDQCAIAQSFKPVKYFYQYTDETGAVVFFRCRIEYMVDGTVHKQMRPLAFYQARESNRTAWSWTEPPETPFYGHHKLFTAPDADVLIVEGEKACDAAQALFPTLVVLTWGNINKTPWAALEGRRVTLWPDNDEPGRRYVEKLVKHITPHAAGVRVVAIWNYDFPRGWDLADPIPVQYTVEELYEASILPRQMDYNVVLENCRWIKDQLWSDEDDMHKAMHRPCRDIRAEQPGAYHWPGPDNCCEFCKCNGLIDRPHDIIDMPSVLLDYVYIAADNKFIHIDSGNIIGCEAFNMMNAATYNKQNNLPNAKQFYTEHEYARRVDQFGYAPGRGPLFIDNGMLRYNTWSQPTVEPITHRSMEPIQPFFDLCDFVFEDDAIQETVLNWMAWVLQNPGKTINWSIIVSGVQGTGKDSLFKPMRMMLHPRNCTEVSEIELDGQFWDFGARQFAIFEETSRGKWGVYNKLKAFLTNDEVLIHKKGLQSYYVPRVTNYCMVTNSEKPLPLEEGDRRWFFHMIPVTTKALKAHAEANPVFFKKFHLMCEDPRAMGILLKWFMDRDVSQFNAKGHAPVTLAKRQLIDRSREAEELFIDDLLVSRSWPFYTGVFSIRMLKKAFRDGGFSITDQMIGVMLRSDRRFRPLWRTRKVVKINGQCKNDTDTIWRLTYAAVAELENMDDKRQMAILMDRIDKEIEPMRGAGNSDSRAQRRLWEACNTGGWLNAAHDEQGNFTGEVAMPGGQPVTQGPPF